jgi:hypothetical protein
MQRLFIEETKSSPRIDFDPEFGLLQISGKSYPENAPKFYTPILDWLREYLARPSAMSVRVIMEITYLNSSSSKAILNLLDLLDTAARSGKDVVIDWRYHEENEVALECGEEFAEEVHESVFNLVQIPSE